MELSKELLILRFCPLFRSFSDERLAELLSAVRYSLRSYAKGETIAFTGDRCEELLIPLKGTVRGEMVDSAGRCLAIEDMKPPTPLAVAFLFGKENLYPVNVVANMDVRLIALPQKAVLQLMMQEPCFLHVFLNLISNRTQFLTEKISFLSFQTIKEKLANYILKQADEAGTLTLPESQERMAELFAVARPSFARGLGELKEAGYIAVQRREITVLDRGALVAILENE